MFTTFVINLDKDTNRMTFMHEQLTKLDIPYRRHTAVLGKEYKPTRDEYDESLAVEKGGHLLLPGEIGCAVSHAQVLQKIVTEKIPHALVLEDDVSLPLNFKEILEEEVKKNTNGQEWDYLLFDYVPVGIVFLRLWFSGIKSNYSNLKVSSFVERLKFILVHLAKAIYIVPLSTFETLRDCYKKINPGPVRFFRPVYFAGAYLVTLDGAEKLLSIAKPVIYTADHLPNRARIETGLHFRCYSPLVVSQQKNVFGSSILELSGKDIQKLHGKEFGL